jgi:hypothetical protein
LNITIVDNDDQRQDLVYSMEESSESFQIDPTTGTVYVRGALDYESLPLYTMRVFVARRQYSTVVEDECIVHIHLIDMNDNAPYLPEGRDVAYVNENALAHMPIATLLPEDDDGTAVNRGAYTFALAHSGGGDTNMFQLDAHTGIVTAMAVFNREYQDVYELRVTMTDAGLPPLSSTQSVFVYILDVNDEVSSNRSRQLLMPVQYSENGLSQSAAAAPHWVSVGRVIPTDQDTVGKYDCTTRAPVHRDVRVAPDCTLHTKGLLFAQNLLMLTANDGVHEPVNYNVHMNVLPLTAADLDAAVLLKFHTSARHLITPTLSQVDAQLSRNANYRTRPVGIDLSADVTHTHLTNIDYAIAIHVFVNIVENVHNRTLSGADAYEAVKSVLTRSLRNVSFDECLTENPCHNNGVCRRVTEHVTDRPPMQFESDVEILLLPHMRRQYACTCERQFAGTYCEHRVDDECSTMICANGGVCVDCNRTGSARCKCAPGYDGPRCTLDAVCTRTAQPCQNGAYCKNGDGGNYTCICLVGYEGRHCESPVDYCAAAVCKK